MSTVAVEVLPKRLRDIVWYTRNDNGRGQISEVQIEHAHVSRICCIRSRNSQLPLESFGGDMGAEDRYS
jgi:hypothetical protein